MLIRRDRAMVAVTVMLRLPMGIWGTVARKYDISLFPTRRRVLFEEAGSGGGELCAEGSSAAQE